MAKVYLFKFEEEDFLINLDFIKNVHRKNEILIFTWNNPPQSLEIKMKSVEDAKDSLLRLLNYWDLPQKEIICIDRQNGEPST